MAAPLFYNQADQNIYDSGIQYLPQEKFRLGPFTPPKTITDEEKIQTSFGIPATSAFTGSNKFDPQGNVFGYGTAVKPGDPYVGSFRKGDPYAGQSGYYGSQNYQGGLPGDYTQKGPGRHFEYDNTGTFYKDYSLTPRKEFPGLVRAAASFVPFGNTTLNFIENKMNPTGPMTADDNPYNRTSYGIAGLSDQQKGLYDSLASQGLLFEGPGGFKTATGKNIVSFADNYVDNQVDLFNDLSADGLSLDDDGNVVDAFGNRVTGFKEIQFLEAYTVNQNQKKQIEQNKKRKEEIRQTQGAIDRRETDINKATEQGQQINENEGIGSVNPNSAYGKKEGYKGGTANPHTQTGWSGSSKEGKSSKGKGRDPDDRMATGGRVGYFYGGLASIL
jgi:hypothetical protein